MLAGVVGEHLVLDAGLVNAVALGQRRELVFGVKQILRDCDRVARLGVDRLAADGRFEDELRVGVPDDLGVRDVAVPPVVFPEVHVGRGHLSKHVVQLSAGDGGERDGLLEGDQADQVGFRHVAVPRIALPEPAGVREPDIGVVRPSERVSDEVSHATLPAVDDFAGPLDRHVDGIHDFAEVGRGHPFGERRLESGYGCRTVGLVEGGGRVIALEVDVDDRLAVDAWTNEEGVGDAVVPPAVDVAAEDRVDVERASEVVVARTEVREDDRVIEPVVAILVVAVLRERGVHVGERVARGGHRVVEGEIGGHRI